MSWYVHINGVNEGPVPAEKVRAWLAHGRISPQHLVWREGMATWQHLSQTELAPVAAKVVALRPSAINGALPATAMNDTPTASAVALGLDPESFDASVFGGFWIRTAAYVTDNAILLFLNLMVTTMFTLMLDPTVGQIVAFPVNMLVGLSYFVVLQSRMDGSLGKKAFGLVLVDEKLQPLSDKQALKRYMMLMLGSLPLYAGLIAVAFHSRKRGWHDRYARTYVLRRHALDRLKSEAAARGATGPAATRLAA